MIVLHDVGDLNQKPITFYLHWKTINRYKLYWIIDRKRTKLKFSPFWSSDSVLYNKFSIFTTNSQQLLHPPNTTPCEMLLFQILIPISVTRVQMTPVYIVQIEFFAPPLLSCVKRGFSESIRFIPHSMQNSKNVSAGNLKLRYIRYRTYTLIRIKRIKLNTLRYF